MDRLGSVLAKTLLIGAVLLFAARMNDVQAAGQRGPNGGQKQQRPPRADKRPPEASTFYTGAPAHDYDVILGRPSRDGITMSVLVYTSCEGFVAHGTSAEKLDQQTSVSQFIPGQPKEITLSKLAPDSLHYYRFCWRSPGAKDFTPGAVHSFHTPRPPGAPFVFTVTADSHLDERTSPAIYQRTLANIAGDVPDFHVDLGDTFMTEKHPSRESAAKQYLAQRYYFGTVANSAPLFLALGNHDGEGGRSNEGGADSLGVWSNTMRKRYFPNPVVAGADTPYTGPLQDYFAWEWGDALCVTLDPFWFTPLKRGNDDNWVNTLGRQQYDWLARTLEQSKAKYKFIFIHHLVGGADKQCRGGSEAAPFYEWGGKNADGSDGFAQHRSGWPAPIHQLLVRNGVAAVFHGHDHFFAKQDFGGIVYQLAPQPATPGGRSVERTAPEYGYRSGVILPSPGYLRIAVGETSAKVTYLSTPTDNGASSSVVSYEYQIPPVRAAR